MVSTPLPGNTLEILTTGAGCYSAFYCDYVIMPAALTLSFVVYLCETYELIATNKIVLPSTIHL